MIWFLERTAWGFYNYPGRMFGIVAGAIVWLLVMIPPIFLARILNPVLDPIFRKHLGHLSVIPAFFSRHIRAAHYASWVATGAKRSGVPGADTFDFRAPFSRRVQFWCLIHFICAFSAGAFFFGAAIYYFVTGR